MKSRALIAILALLCLVATCHSIDEEISAKGVREVQRIILKVDASGVVTIEKLILVNASEVEVPMLLKFNMLKVHSSDGTPIKFSIIRRNHTPYVKFTAEKGSVVRLSYISNHIVSKNGSVWKIHFTDLTTPQITIVELHLPKGSKIMFKSPEVLFSTIEDGFYFYPQFKRFSFEVEYVTPFAPTPKPIEESYLYLAISLLFLLILVFSIHIYFIKKRGKEEKKRDEAKITKPRDVKRKRKVKESILQVLDENERKIVKILESREEEVTQAFIYKTTGIPKATLSEIMSRLEKRNIIERVRAGRVKWVKLKDWVFK